jgi:hypothetical protein
MVLESGNGRNENEEGVDFDESTSTTFGGRTEVHQLDGRRVVGNITVYSICSCP